MIKTIIFDIGGVLIGYDWTAYMMKEFNNDAELVERIKANVFGDKWAEVDRGVLTNEELVASFIKDAPDIKDEIIHFWETAGDALWQYDFAKDWIRNTGDVFRLQKLLGHTSLDMTRNYVNMFSEDLKKDFEEYNPLDRLKKGYSRTHTVKKSN